MTDRQPSDDELLDTLTGALVDLDRNPPPERVAALRAAVEDRRRAEPPAITPMEARTEHRPGGAVGGRLRRLQRSTPSSRLAPVVVGGALAAAAVLVAVLGMAALRATDEPGVLEFDQALDGLDGRSVGDVRGVRVGTGRIVRIQSEDLPILPTGEFYEVWFATAQDTVGEPDRISAGTFHPDTEGRTDVELSAAVDPSRYPILIISSEPGDGDPSPSPTEVARVDLDLLGGG